MSDSLTSTVDQAECLAALWCIGAGNRTLCDVGGAPDRALFAVRDELEAMFGLRVHFYETSVGRRCVELPNILLCMQECGYAECDGGTFTSYRMCMTPEAATMALYRDGVTPSARLAVAKRFCEAVRIEYERINVGH